jgi:AcrR family transcriptional regulator
MRESTDLKETILREAEELFAAHGYAGTSIKQIAGASGCTTAALYYYFADGKSQILREVVRSSFSPELATVIQAGRNATSLGEWVRIFGNTALLSLHHIERRQTWVEPEMHQLGDHERAIIHQNLLDAHQQISVEIARFVEDESKANKLAWILIMALFGYGKMFKRLELGQVSDFSATEFVETIAWIIGKAVD